MKIRFEGYSLDDLDTIKNKYSLSSRSDAARYAASFVANGIRNENIAYKNRSRKSPTRKKQGKVAA